MASLLLLLYMLLRGEKLDKGPYILVAFLLSMLALLISTTKGLASPTVFLGLYLSLAIFIARNFVGRGGDSSAIGPFILWPILLSLVLPALYIFSKGGVHKLGSGGFSTLHLWLMTAASCSSAMACGAGVALALQDYCLKAKKPLPKSITVPSLATADSVVYQLAGLTFALLTLSVIAASMTVSKTWGSWRWEPRTMGALLLWLLYGLGLHMRRIAGWRGQRFGLIVISGFLLILFVFFLLHLGVVT